MWSEQDRFKAVDPTILLQGALVVEGFLKDLQRLELAAPHDGTPTEEQRVASHL